MKILFLLTILSFATILLDSCTCAPDISTPQEIDPTTKAQLRILHFSPGTPLLQVRQNDRAFVSGIEYGVPTAQYKEIPSGIRNLRFLSEQDLALYSINVALEKDVPYTLLLLDSVQRVGSILLDDIPPHTGQDSIALRFIHAGIGAGNASLHKGSASGSSLFTAIDFRSFTSYKLIAKGESLNLSVETPSGTQVFLVDSSTLTGASSYTLVLSGIASSSLNPLNVAVIKG